MKNFFASLTAVFLLISGSNAQTKLNQGLITFQISNVKADDPQVEMMMGGLKDSKTEVFFDENNHAMKMEMMGGMLKITNLGDYSSSKNHMLMDMMGQKIWVESDMGVEKLSEAEKKSLDNIKVSYDENDTKTILGYKCYKMELINPDMADTKVYSYISKDIETKANIIQGFENVKMEGFPLEYTVVNPMMTMTMVATKISDTVDKSKFTLNTKGYKKMTMEEFKSSMGNFGGMGF